MKTGREGLPLTFSYIFVSRFYLTDVPEIKLTHSNMAIILNTDFEKFGISLARTCFPDLDFLSLFVP